MAPSSSSSATTSVQVALRIRPPTNQDSTSIPARFQRPVIHATSSTTVSVEAVTNAGTSGGPPTAAPASATGAAQKKQSFSFDQVHGPPTTQHSMFTSTAQPLIGRFLEGFNCTILAYGQTSSGKTFTMTGIDLDADPSDPNNGMGIIPRSVSTIFSHAKQLKDERSGTWNFSVKGSFIEIYNEDLIDLLSLDDGAGGRREVQIREAKDGHIIWGGLREVNVKNSNEVMALIRKGTSIRRTNETDMNAQSSRSHAIFSLTLTQKKFTGSGAPPRSSSPLPPNGRSPSRLARPGSVYGTSSSATGSRVASPTFGRPQTPSFAAAMARGGGLRPASSLGHSSEKSLASPDDESGEWVTIVSKFHFVDLAGSERLKRTAAAGERIKEGISINSGLLALGNVISALGDPARAKSHTATHVPYRDSKLTRLLQDSLGGNAHTLMIACVSPAEWNAGETINTIKYANRARNIKNRAVVNEKEDGWDDIEWLQGTVTRLRKEVKGLKDGGAFTSPAAQTSEPVEGAGRKVLAQMTELQNNYEDLREKYVERTEELTRLRQQLGETHRGSTGIIGGTAKYEEIVGPVIEEYEKTIATMEAELSLNRAALRHTNEMVEEKEEELASLTDRHAATELYVEELRARVSKLGEREATTEAYVRDLEERMKSYDETSLSSSESMSDLKREVAKFRDTETQSGKYIAELEARLARSDESVISLQQSVETLERECERRREEVSALEGRLDSLRKDGESWRTDLEEREKKVRDLEEKMETWERKRKDANDTRIRLGEVVDEVASARKSLEVDMASIPRSSGEPSPASDEVAPTTAPDANLEGQFVALQQTHTATLADLATVTNKYRDALREISDLAAQIQEAKLNNESLSSPSDKLPDSPSIRRRMTSGRLREASEPQYNAAGRRLFFRQAASTESLHSRSLSQSQSLSQELSSVRSRKASISSQGTVSSHSPSNSHSALNLHSSRPSLSISLPNGAPGSPGERSVTSLEKEIMRLQEVLKERETEISVLEESLKQSQTEGSSLPSTNGSPSQSQLNGTASLAEAALSPKTIDQFDHIRKTMETNGHVHINGHETSSDRGGSVSENDESLDRLNELMLSMAQKESQHREIVDGLNSQLTQIRRQHDDLVTLSRDQAINMSSELESLRAKHTADLESLEVLRQRETDLLNSLQEVEEKHLASVETLKSEHASALQAKESEVAEILARLKEEHAAAISAVRVELSSAQSSLESSSKDHDDSLGSLRAELTAATSSLETSKREHEKAFGQLKAEHAEELRTRLQEAHDLLAQTKEEHEKVLAKKDAEQTEASKQHEAQAASALQQTEEDYYNLLTNLRSSHAEELSKQAAEAAATLERVKEEHAGELRIAEIAREGSLSESNSAQTLALQDLRDEHAAATTRKEASFAEELAALKAEHARSLTTRGEDHTIELEKLRAEHEGAVMKMKEEWRQEAERLNASLHAAKGDNDSQVSKAAAELTSLREQHAALLKEVEAGHSEEIAKLKSSFAAELQQLSTKAEHDRIQLVKDHAETSAKLRTQHEEAVATLENKITAMQTEHSSALEDLRKRGESSLDEERAGLSAKLKSSFDAELQRLLAKAEGDRNQLVKDHTETSAKLRSQHEEALAALENSKIALQNEHISALEDIRKRSESSLNEERVALSQALEDLKRQHAAERETLVKDHELLVQELETHKVAADEFTLLREETRQSHGKVLDEKVKIIKGMEQRLSEFEDERDSLKMQVAKLRAELDRTKGEQTKLVQEASKRESLVMELDRHRSVLAEMQENLQRVKDEKDAIQVEKNKSDTLVRDLQAQLARGPSPPPGAASPGRPTPERTISSYNRPTPGMKLPPPTPPPSVPPPPAPRSTVQHPSTDLSVSSHTSSGVTSSSSKDSQQPESPVTSVGHPSSIPPAAVASDPKVTARIEQQAKQLDEQEVMIKTLNKQLTHCESDLQTHMDLVSTLETSLTDSEKNLRKARMHATEIARERDTLNSKVEALRNELTEAKREVVNVRQSIVEEKQSYEQRLDEERRAKERARQQLDSRMEELTGKRKSKFACL